MPHFGLEQFAPYVLYFGAIAALLASFRRPSAGLYLLVLTLPLQTIRAQVAALPLGNKFIDILLLGLVIGVLHREGIAGFNKPLSALLFFVAVFYYISLWQGAFYLNTSLPLGFGDIRFSNWKNYVEMFLFCVVTVSTIRDERQAKWLFVVMAVSTLLVNKGYYSALSDRDLSHFSYDRYAGTLGYAGENGFAAFEVMTTAFFLGIAAYIKKPLLRLGLLALAGTSIYCILFSFSREAYLALLASMLLLGILKDRKLIIVVAVVLVAWETVLPQSVQERIAMTTQTSDADGTGQLDTSSATRVELWQDALDLFSTAPVFGIGFDTYEFLGRVRDYSDTHNYYVKLLLETGVVGLILFLWLLGKMWGLGYMLFRHARDPFWTAVGLGFLGLICAATVVNLFGDRWMYQQVDGYMWITLGCVIRGLLITREQANQVSQSDIPMDLPVSEAVPSGVLTA